MMISSIIPYGHTDAKYQSTWNDRPSWLCTIMCFQCSKCFNDPWVLAFSAASGVSLAWVSQDQDIVEGCVFNPTNTLGYISNLPRVGKDICRDSNVERGKLIKLYKLLITNRLNRSIEIQVTIHLWDVWLFETNSRIPKVGTFHQASQCGHFWETSSSICRASPPSFEGQCNRFQPLGLYIGMAVHVRFAHGRWKII